MHRFAAATRAYLLPVIVVTLHEPTGAIHRSQAVAVVTAKIGRPTGATA